MSEKGANIDLLFRNGLKDYEVLPPAGVWDGIQSAVKVKSRPIILLRVAAVITVLLTLSFFTYRWSMENSGTPESVVAYNIQAFDPIISVPLDKLKPLEIKENNRFNNTTAFAPVNNTTDVAIDFDINDSPAQPLSIMETRSLSISNTLRAKNSLLTSFNILETKSPEINYPDFQYLPENNTPKLVNRWSITAMASPTYYSAINAGSDALSSQILSSEQPLFSYSGGLAFSYKISKRFSIQSGLYYSSLGQKVDGINSYSGFQQYGTTKSGHNFEVLTSSGTVVTSNPDIFLSADGAERIVTAYTKDVFDPNKASLQPVNTSLDQNLSYLEFPVILRYKLVDKTIGINLIGGLSYNLLVHNSVSTTLDGNVYPVGDTKGLNPLSLSSSLGMGMEYNISSKLSLNLEPTFRYYLNPFSVTSGTYIHPYSFGIFSGVSYKF